VVDTAVFAEVAKRGLENVARMILGIMPRRGGRDAMVCLMLVSMQQVLSVSLQLVEYDDDDRDESNGRRPRVRDLAVAFLDEGKRDALVRLEILFSPTRLKIVIAPVDPYERAATSDPSIDALVGHGTLSGGASLEKHMVRVARNAMAYGGITGTLFASIRNHPKMLGAMRISNLISVTDGGHCCVAGCREWLTPETKNGCPKCMGFFKSCKGCIEKLVEHVCECDGTYTLTVCIADDRR
jgi:hypothetical protein